MKDNIINMIKKEKKFIGIVIIVVMVGIAALIFKDDKEEIVLEVSKYTLLENDYYIQNYSKAYDGTVREVDKDAYQFNEEHQLVGLNRNLVDDNFEYTSDVDIEYNNNTINYTSNTTSNGTSSNSNHFYKLQYQNDLIDKMDMKSVINFSDGSQKIMNKTSYLYYNDNQKVSKIVNNYYSEGTVTETVVNDFEYYEYDNEVVVCEKININSELNMENIIIIYYEKDIKKDMLSQIGRSMPESYTKNIIEKDWGGNSLQFDSFYNLDRIIYANKKGYNKFEGSYGSESIWEYDQDDLLGIISKEIDIVTKKIQTKKYAIYKEDNKYYYLSETNKEKIQQLLDAKNKQAEKSKRLSSDKEYALIYEYDYTDQNNITITSKIISQGSKLFKRIKAYEFNTKNSQKIIDFVLKGKKTESPEYDYKKEPQKYVEQYLLDNKIVEKNTYTIEIEDGMSDDKNIIVYHIINKHGGTIGWYSLNKTTGEINDYMMDDENETTNNENQSEHQNNNENTKTEVETETFEQTNDEIVPDNENQAQNDKNDKEKEYQASLKVIQYIEKNMSQINRSIYEEAYKRYKDIEWKSSRSIDMKNDLSVIVMEVQAQEAMETQEITHLKNIINDFKNKYQ